MFIRLVLVVILGLGISTGTPRDAKAASILLDAGNITELTTFTFSQFEGGFSINGSTPTSGGSFTFGDGTPLNFTGQWLDLGQATNFSRTVYWLDFLYPGAFVGILNYSVTASGASGLATISGFFNAEDDGGVGLLPGGVDPADIIVMDTSLSHDPFAFSAPFLTGQVVMGLPKANPPTGVIPLPAAGLLLLSAFGGMAVFAHRNGQKRRLNA